MNEIFVFDSQSDRRTERFAVSDAGKNFNLIAFDFHTPAAPVALLSAPKFVIYTLDINFQSGRQSFDDGDECFAVRFSGGCNLKT